MPSPLKWNASREWQFHVSFARPVIYLLRDHVTLITDLSKDWTSGPPVEYTRFVPIVYRLRLTFKDIRLGVYLNDHNVIDYPLVDSQNSKCDCVIWFFLRPNLFSASASLVHWPHAEHRSSYSIGEISSHVVDSSLLPGGYSTGRQVDTTELEH